nr:hypothetical protein [Tanacetum cinerariifolium]
MHNNIMAVGSRDRPPMLAPRRYPQWRSRFLRYVDTRPNSEGLRKCILSGPYKPTTILVHAIEAIDDSPAVPEHTTVETPTNMSPENKAHFLAEKEAIHLILTGIGDDIYLTVDACQTAQEIWEAIERLQQGQRLISSTTSAKMVKQYQNEVNELCAEKLARNANPLALVATAQASQVLFYQTSRSYRSSTPSPKPSIPSRSHTTTKHKGNEIDKPITPPSETVFEEDNYPKQAQRDKDMQKNLALIAKTVNIARARENVGSKVVHQSGIQCFNCKEYGHFAKECRKPKSVKDSAYHKEKMLMCNKAKQVETDDSNVIPDSLDMCEDDIQNEENDVESDDERQLAHKDTIIREGLKTKAYELPVVNEKHDELMKQSLLTKSHYEGLVKQKTKVITDSKLREEHDIEKMLSMEKQLKFLNEIVYKRSQSIQTIHMMAPKVATYNGRLTFSNPIYLKQAQSEIPCLYALPYDQNAHANRLIPYGEETLALERESRSKLNNDLVRPYDYTKLNSLYEIFKPWNLFRAPTAHDMEILIQTCLMPLAIKTQSDSLKFVYELKQEMHANLKYVESLKKEIDKLESDKAEFSDMYDVILQEFISKDVM